MISVDGDTSTNDTVLLLANGMADNKKIKYGTKEYEQFKKALHYVNETLAKEMAGDGEGATALFEVKVVGAKTKRAGKGFVEIDRLLKFDENGNSRSRCELGQNPLCDGIFTEHSLILRRWICF